MKKTKLSLIIIAAFTTFVLGVIVGTQFLPQVSPQLGPTASFIRANSCDADSLCETNGLMSRNNVDLSGVLKITLGNSTNTTLATTSIAVFEKTVQFLSSINIDQNLDVDGYASIRGNIYNNQGSIQTKSIYFTVQYRYIRSNELSGSGSAYVCVDSNGYLFRSNNPCR